MSLKTVGSANISKRDNGQGPVRCSKLTPLNKTSPGTSLYEHMNGDKCRVSTFFPPLFLFFLSFFPLPCTLPPLADLAADTGTLATDDSGFLAGVDAGFGAVAEAETGTLDAGLSPAAVACLAFFFCFLEAPPSVPAPASLTPDSRGRLPAALVGLVVGAAITSSNRLSG